jgi:hypothetical protein
MITLFLIIAFFIRKKFLPENASREEKVMYYLFSVVLTPLFGPILIKNLYHSPIIEDKKSDDDGCADIYSINKFIDSL